MSGYSARRAPNVSQYIADLNTIPSPQESVTHQDGYGVEEDLSLFTSAEFFDFDLGENLEESPISYDHAKSERVRRENASGKRAVTEINNMGFDQNSMFISH